MVLRTWWLFAGVILWTGCSGVPVPAASLQPVPEPPQGHLFIVGGGPRPAELMQHFVELAGGPGGARIAVIPTASADPATAGERLVEEMRSLGADAFSLNLTRAEADDEATIGRLVGATGVWFSGGVQSRHTDTLKHTPVEAAIHTLYRDGAVIGGTSAGAAIMSEVMITGAERRPGGDRPPRSRDPFITIDRDNVVTAEGFGFLPGAIVDQHFVRRKRHNRLLSLVLENPEQIGIGIDEGTALVVRPDGLWEVLGEGTALVYDARDARVTEPRAPVLGTAGVRLHVLPAGSVYDPAAGRATLPQAGARRETREAAGSAPPVGGVSGAPAPVPAF